LDPTVLLLGAATLMLVGSASNLGFYGPRPLLLVALGTVLVVAAATTKRMDAEAGSRPPVTMLTAVAAIFLCSALFQPAGLYYRGSELVASRYVSVATCLVVLCALVTRVKKPMLTLAGTAAMATTSGVLTIRATPRPPIDVWYMLQTAAHSTLHGSNPYSQMWTSGIPHEVSNHFTYLPGTAVFLAPFYAVFGDVRYGVLATVIATGVLIGRVSRSELAPYLGCLFLIAPRLDYLVEFAWIDPLLLLAVTCGVLALRRGRSGWAVVALAAALLVKQYALLLLPLGVACREIGWRRTVKAAALAAVVTLPFVAADPSAFWSGTVTLLAHRTPRPDSLSIPAALLAHGHKPSLALAALSLGALLGVLLWRRAGSLVHFLTALAALMAVFDLTGTWQFFNEWWLAAGYAVLASAAATDLGRAPGSGAVEGGDRNRDGGIELPHLKVLPGRERPRLAQIGHFTRVHRVRPEPKKAWRTVGEDVLGAP
jgi:hypothetical protein